MKLNKKPGNGIVFFCMNLRNLARFGRYINVHLLGWKHTIHHCKNRGSRIFARLRQKTF